METNLKKYKLFNQAECKSIIDEINNNKIWNKTNTSYVITTFLHQDLWYSRRITEWLSNEFELSDAKIKEGFWGTCFKYFPNAYFNEHIDVLTDKKSYPIYNINVILNDDFTGGNFFLNKIEYDTLPGFIYKYKSNEKHGVTKVTDGIRYTLVYHLFDYDLIKSEKTLF